MPIQPNPHSLNHLEQLGVLQPVPRIQFPATSFKNSPPPTAVHAVTAAPTRQPVIAPAMAMAPRVNRPAPVAQPANQPVINWWPLLPAFIRGFLKGIVAGAVTLTGLYVLRLFGVLSIMSLVAITCAFAPPTCSASETPVVQTDQANVSTEAPKIEDDEAPLGNERQVADGIVLKTEPLPQPDFATQEVAIEDVDQSLIEMPIDFSSEENTVPTTAGSIEGISRAKPLISVPPFDWTMDKRFDDIHADIQQLAKRLDVPLEDGEPNPENPRVVISSEYPVSTSTLALVLASFSFGFAIGYTMGRFRNKTEFPHRLGLIRSLNLPIMRKRRGISSENGSPLRSSSISKAAPTIALRASNAGHGSAYPTKNSSFGGLNGYPRPDFFLRRPWCTAVGSIVGPVRSENQDYVRLVQPLPGVELLAVADGCGGLPHGSRAAQVAVHAALKAISGDLREGSTLGEAVIAQGFEAACMALVSEAHKLGFDPGKTNDRFGLNTTLILVLADHNKYHFGYIGDGGMNLLRASDELIELMQPQRHGNISNMLSACLGPRPHGEAVLGTIDRQSSDLLLVATDGIADHYDPFTLASHLKMRVVEAEGDTRCTIDQFLAEINEQTDESGLPLFDDNLSIALMTDGNPLMAEAIGTSTVFSAKEFQR